MATQTDSTYFWDLGIDWGLIPTIANASFMPGGFIVRATNTIQRPRVLTGQTIIFRIFDLGKGDVTRIESFTINPQIAVGSGYINPLQDLQPDFVALGNEGNQESSVFFEVGGPFPCWRTGPVVVTANVNPGKIQKYLLNFFVQATGNVEQEPVLRTFVHDPEMIVGEN